MIYELNQEIADIENAITNPNLSDKKISKLKKKLIQKKNELLKLKRNKIKWHEENKTVYNK